LIKSAYMIHRLILKNFKRIREEVFEFNNFDLIVGANNSGKSTALQALAIWQYCVDQFALSKRKGSRGIQVVLPNFTALPLPEFNLLWTDRIGQASNQYIYIEIDVYWKDEANMEQNFCVQMRYQSPQAVFAIPQSGWTDFSEKINLSSFPKVVYVPPFSGLEPHEPWMDDGNVRQKIGKAQPGSVLRNLLYRVIDREDVHIKQNLGWQEIKACVSNWFGIDLQMPEYEKGVSVEIKAEYKVSKKTFDIISGGSGFHQILTLLAFVHGYPNITTILFDEPDAHLHVNLQRQIVNYFKTKSDKQFLIATHSEEFIKGVEINSILSMLSGQPRRVQSSHAVLHALSEVDNIDVVRTEQSPYILYLEGEDDERLLSVWAEKLGKTDVYEKFYPYILGGSSKKEMQQRSDAHYQALKQIVNNVRRVLLLDYDSDDVAINPAANNMVLNEWKRKNIDNYLFVPSVWKKAVAVQLNQPMDSLFLQDFFEIIDSHFANENLLLPPGATWVTVKASIFRVLDGKKLLFENQDSLFEKLKQASGGYLKLNRLSLASNMEQDEIHEDIARFFTNLEAVTLQ
jgi:predicted ATPase